MLGGTVAVFLRRDLAVVEGPKLREAGSPFSLKLSPKAVSRNVRSAIPYVERDRSSLR